MRIAVPDYVLTVERSRLSEFFLLFARFEFALKASNYAKAGRNGAEVNWKKFADIAEVDFFSSTDSALNTAIKYLESEPPKQQKYSQSSLNWEARPAPNSYSRMQSVLFFTQGVRNNLVHGAKFLAKETNDYERDLRLLTAAELIISACISSNPNVHKAFDSEAL